MFDFKKVFKKSPAETQPLYSIRCPISFFFFCKSNYWNISKVMYLTKHAPKVNYWFWVRGWQDTLPFELTKWVWRGWTISMSLQKVSCQSVPHAHIPASLIFAQCTSKYNLEWKKRILNCKLIFCWCNSSITIVCKADRVRENKAWRNCVQAERGGGEN